MRDAYSGAEGVIERGERMGVQIIHDQEDFLVRDMEIRDFFLPAYLTRPAVRSILRYFCG